MRKHTHILLLFLVIFVSSCGRDVSKAFDKLKAECASSNDLKKQLVPSAKCREWFPIADKESETIIKYLPGKPILVPDTTYVPMVVDCDEITKKGSGKQTIKVPVPVYLRVDTASVVKNVRIKDMREIVYWQGKFLVEEDDKRKIEVALLDEKSKNSLLYKQVRNLQFKLYGIVALIVLLIAAWVLKKTYFKSK